MSDRIIGEDGKKEEEKITEDKNKNMQNDEVENTSSEHANINDVGGEEIVTTDNVIHEVTAQDEDDKKVKEEPKIADMKGHHVETMSVYVNDDQITGYLEYTQEMENEKQVRLGIIGNSLEISKIEDEIDAELIKNVKVEDSEERIKRLKEVLELLQGYTMSMDRIKNNGNETELKSPEKKEGESVGEKDKPDLQNGMDKLEKGKSDGEYVKAKIIEKSATEKSDGYVNMEDEKKTPPEEEDGKKENENKDEVEDRNCTKEESGKVECKTENSTENNEGKGIEGSENIVQSLSEILVNCDKTEAEIEAAKKQVHFQLEPEDMGMENIQNEGGNLAVDISVGSIVNKLFVVQETGNEVEMIDDAYIKFSCSQTYATEYLEEMEKKGNEKYVVETEDISDAENGNSKTDDEKKTIEKVDNNGNVDVDRENLNKGGTVIVTNDTKIEEEGNKNEDTKVDVDMEKNQLEKTEEKKEDGLNEENKTDEIHKKDGENKKIEEDRDDGDDDGKNDTEGGDGLVYVER